MAKKKPPVKCPGCEERFYREDTDFVHVKNRYWHKDCYEKTQEELQTVDLLDEYICNLFGTTFVSPRIRKQINSYIKNYGFTHSGILGSLKYWFEIRGGSIEKANGGIGIVPYIYNDAKDYFNKIYQAQKNNAETSELIGEHVVIVIPPRTAKIRTLKPINLDFLEGDEG